MSDRRGRRGLLAAACVALLLGSGCSSDAADDDLASSTPGATEVCAAPTFPQVQFGSHLLGDTAPPVPYTSVPPTSGWHSSGAIPLGVSDTDDPLTEPEQVSVLEVGAVVISYNDVPASTVSDLVDLVEGTFAGRTSLTAYGEIPRGSMALTAWGVVQTCQAIDIQAVETFVTTYAVEEPEVPGTDAQPRVGSDRNTPTDGP